METEGTLNRLEVKKLWAAATYEKAFPLGKDRESDFILYWKSVSKK